MNESQRCFIDVLSRLIDAPTQFRRKQGNLPENLDEQLKQLPWSLETAIIKYLNRNKSDWFKNDPKPKFNVKIFNNADESKYYTGQFELLDYRFSDKLTPIFDHCDGIARSSRVPLSVEQWLERHGLFESSGDNPDPHFAERAFVINVLVPCCGADILEYVTPQFEVENPVNRKKYKIDFLIKTGDLPIAIEVDGAEYHDPQKIDGTRFEYELERTNFIQSLGYKHYRIPARKVLHVPEDCINELKSLLPEFKKPQQENLFKQNVKKPTDMKPLSKADKVLALMGILNTEEEKQSLDYSEEDIELSTTIREYVKWFRPFQLSILLALVNAGEKNEFIVQEKASPSGLIEAALLDLKTLITFAQAFYCTEFNFPKKIIINKPQNTIHDFGNEILEIYRGAGGPDNIDNGYEKYVPYEVATFYETHAEPDLIVDISRDGRIPIVPDGTLKPDVLGNESANLSTLRARLQALSAQRSGLRNTLKPQNLEKRIIDYFARRYLRIPALYHHMDEENPKQERRQYEIVKEVLEGHSVFGIMPTGQGKSVAFQLPSILLPGGAMVISPLRALMRDQIEDLVKNRGFNSVETITSDMDKSEKDIALDDFMQGYTNLLYLSPERLQIVSFQEKLAEAAATVHISFLAIDETHCVSEWGHDFRLSYLHIPDFMNKIDKMQGEKPPIVALTATATIPVRRDVCQILSLTDKDGREGGNVISEANIDRPELSFSVHLVEGSSYPDDKQTILKDVLTQKIPAAMKNSYEDFDWDRFSHGDWETGTGAIFCIYASPVGQTTWRDGVGAVKEYLSKEAEIIQGEKVRHYSSDTPKYCPKCGSLAIRRLASHELDEDETSDTGSYTCVNDCNFTIPGYRNEREWNTYCIDTQRRFKLREFPLLVSTKAYGMGIDNRGLKFIVHYGMSSSIEGYYQEAGRAGRDGFQSHCALIVRMPHYNCWNDNVSKLDSSSIDRLPCKTTNLLKCVPPYSLPEPCDFARQVRMVLRYYIKPDRFAKACASFWEELLALSQTGRDLKTRRVCGGGLQGDYRIQQRQAYLHRLRQLGLISNFMLEYQPHRNHFDVVFHLTEIKNISPDDLKENLTQRLFEIYQAPKAEEIKKRDQKADKEKARESATGVSQGTNSLSKILVEKAVFELFSTIRNYVLDMRLQSLRKLMFYVNQEQSCRRRDLLGGLDYVHGAEEDRCDFCDVCVPSLEFKTERARVPKESVQFRDVISSVHDAFRYEDIDQIISSTTKAKHLKILDTVGMHAMTKLESDPYNIAANLTAGIAFASDKNESRKISASMYFQRYSDLTNVDKKDFDLAKKGYENHKNYNKAEAIVSYASEDSAFDSEEGIALLDEEAQNTDIPKAKRENLKVIRYAVEYKTVMSNLLETLSNEVEEFL